MLAELCRASESADGISVARPASGETLWEFFHRRKNAIRQADGRPLTVVLAFDQFEEFFTLGKEGSDQAGRGSAFLTQLADLIENRLPAALAERAEQDESFTEQFDFDRGDVRVLISLREDFLPHLESLRSVLPAVAENRFRLTQMNGIQALQAVLEPGGELVTSELGRQIVRFVAEGRSPADGGSVGAANGNLDSLEVEPAYLSLFCRELNSAVLPGIYRKSRRIFLPAIAMPSSRIFTSAVSPISRSRCANSSKTNCSANRAIESR